MKRYTYVLLGFCLIFAMSLSFVACGHECELSSEWSSDDASHWHDCTAEECELVSDKGDHTWNAGEITTEATRKADGVKTYTCTVCNKTKTEPIVYVHECEISTEWSSDEASHWHDCTDTECDLIFDKGDHTWNEGEITAKATQEADGVKTYTCTVCQNTKTEAVAYTGMTKSEWDAAFSDATFENFSYTELAEVKGAGFTMSTETAYKFTSENAWLKITLVGQSEEAYAPDLEIANALKVALVESIKAIAPYESNEYDAETKTYKAVSGIYIESLEETSPNITLKFSDGKLIEMKYFVDVEQNGIKMSAEATSVLFDYGTTVVNNPNK